MRSDRFRLAVLTALAALASGPVLAALSIYLSPEDLARTSPIVVEGEVSGIACGYDPETGALATYVTIAVEIVHRGPESLAEVVVREPGGRYGDLVHELDAVPVFEPEERVLVFVEIDRGSPRTAGMFFGKFTVVEGTTRDADRAVRDLSGQGLILRRPDLETEDLPLRDLVAVLENNPYRGSSPAASALRPFPGDPSGAKTLLAPPEMGGLLWDGAVATVPDGPEGERGGGEDSSFLVEPAESAPAETSLFTPLSTTSPARWFETDSGTAIPVRVEQARNPLDDGPAAAYEMRRAMAAWTNVPEGRIALQCADDDYDFTGTVAQSPADSYPPVNILLFGDPYEDITDPVNCSGVLAIGGYWRSGTVAGTVNNVTFYPELRLYVIFNDNFECFLGDPNDLAEVAAHELGHGVGLGHSTVYDALMRSYVYGNRGPRLGDDDRDGAHCHYPHALSVTSPNGGESWTAGTVRSIAWTSTAEAGPDPGTVSLQYSTDSGSSWTTLVSGEPNDGSYTWTVPDAPGTRTRVRVLRPNRVSPTPSPYPSACSSDASNADFAIVAALEAGTVPGTGTPLRVQKSGSDLTVTWGASCAATASDYAIYEGTLAALRSCVWDHVSRTCTAGTDFTQTLTPGSGNRYYLVAPLAGSYEGTLGLTSWGILRPAAAAACAPREAESCQ